MGVEAVIKRVAARGGMYKALSSINGVWPTSGAKSIVHSCPVVDGSVCSIFPVLTPKLTAQQIHNAFDALGDALLPRESNQFLSHGLLPEKGTQRKKIGAGKWTTEKLFKRNMTRDIKELRTGLGLSSRNPLPGLHSAPSSFTRFIHSDEFFFYFI